MAQEFSASAIEQIYSEDGPATAILISLDSPSLEEPIRASSDPDGTTSRGLQYDHFPFSFLWSGAGQDEPSRGAKLEIANTDARIGRAVRSLPAGAQISATAEMILVDAPDDVEMAVTDARVGDVEIDDPKVTANIEARSFSTEPANQARYIKARTPGLL